MGSHLDDPIVLLHGFLQAALLTGDLAVGEPHLGVLGRNLRGVLGKLRRLIGMPHLQLHHRLAEDRPRRIGSRRHCPVEGALRIGKPAKLQIRQTVHREELALEVGIAHLDVDLLEQLRKLALLQVGSRKGRQHQRCVSAIVQRMTQFLLRVLEVAETLIGQANQDTRRKVRRVACQHLIQSFDRVCVLA